LRYDTFKIFKKIYSSFQIYQNEYNMYLYIKFMVEKNRQTHSFLIFMSKLNIEKYKKNIFIFNFQIPSSSLSSRKFVSNFSWANLQKSKLPSTCSIKCLNRSLNNTQKLWVYQSSDTTWNGISKSEVQNKSRKRLC